ncbi:MAG: hypothetical protein ISR56_01630 [Bacteroidales bacterium]|nr:hypothetical protein [Bacteroidales bacterium]
MAHRLNKKKSIFIVLIIILILIIGLTCNNKKSYYNNIDVNHAYKELNIKKIDSSLLLEAINLSGDYLIRNIKNNGQFVYKVNLDSTEKNKPAYNTLRHAGAIYALCMYYDLSENLHALQVATKAADFMKDQLMAPLDSHPELIGVWSYGKINHDSDPTIVKLGGNGLGLLSLAYLEKLKPGTTDISILRRMADFILFMQKKNGGFYSKYFIDRRGRDDSWTSLYYPGEAALGLMMLYEIDKDNKWLDGAAKALKYLANLRKDETVVEADHWALIATRKLLKYYNDLELDIPAELFIDHGMQICKSMIMEMPQFPSDSPYYGCMTFDGRTTPTSTRLEGLLSFEKIIPEKRESLIYSILMVSNNAIEFLEKAQVKKGYFAGGMTRTLSGPSINPAMKGFETGDRRDSEIRIDYVQHALCAWIQYYELIYKEVETIY